ncbi:MAG: hypothetical protein HWE24_02475 [Oceanospirillaceae bacterium]|nr:hypothetical protein [Oceanospirillaceae bacterium]
MKKILSVFLVLLSHSVFALDLAKYPTELTSGEGVNVVIAPTVDNTQALVKVTGVNNEIDGVVFLAKVNKQGDDQRLKYTYDGSKRTLIYIANNYGCCSYTLYLPDGKDGIYLGKKDEVKSDTVQAISALYDQQLQQGVQKKLAMFNRKKHLAYQKNKIQQADDNVAKQCDTEIPTKVDWNKISDSDLGSYAIAAYCAQVSSKIADQCAAKPDFKETAKEFKEIRCDFTDKLKLRLNDHVLNFKTAPKAPNQGQFIEAYLNNM